MRRDRASERDNFLSKDLHEHDRITLELYNGSCWSLEIESNVERIGPSVTDSYTSRDALFSEKSAENRFVSEVTEWDEYVSSLFLSHFRFVRNGRL